MIFNSILQSEYNADLSTTHKMEITRRNIRQRQSLAAAKLIDEKSKLLLASMIKKRK